MDNSNEAASSVYTTDFITKMLKEEGGELFDARSASLGHTLQGGVPSPMDRARAVRLSLKCMAFIEKHHQSIHTQKVKHAGPETAAVITIQGSAIKWVPVQDMVQHADMKNRRGKHAWWGGVKELVEALVGLPQLSGL
jgi:6-phosphofructokinase 1